MSAAYREAPSGIGRSILIFLMFAAGGLGVFALTPRSVSGWIPFAGATLAGILGLVVAGVEASRRNRVRVEGIGAMLRGKGWSTNLSPDEQSRAEALAQYPHLVQWLWLEGGAAGVRWIACSGDGRTRIFEHTHLFGVGEDAQLHVRTVVVREGFTPHVWLHLQRVNQAARRGHPSAAASVITTGQAGFDRDWVVSGDAESAAAVLGPRVRAALAGAPVGEVWLLGGGVLALAFLGYVDRHALSIMLDRLDASAPAVAEGAEAASRARSESPAAQPTIITP